jgi:ankyrin repeat protein
MHWAAEKGHTEICRALLDFKADVNALDKWDVLINTNLSSAYCCHLLLNRIQRTPLHWAAIKGHSETCRALLDFGAIVNALDKWVIVITQNTTSRYLLIFHVYCFTEINVHHLHWLLWMTMQKFAVRY